MKFRYIRRVVSDLIFMPLVVGCMIYAPLVVYGLRMAKGQLTIVMDAREVKDVLQDATVPDSIKEKLKLIEEIRQFAFDSIGLKRNDNYTTFYDQHGRRLIYVVTACKPFALEPHLWNFPVLGDVPYKGFFNADKAKTEAAELKKEGYDVDIGGASGWSTLGFFKDPILSQMLNAREGDLAELIIHELTHGTIFVKDKVELNENLASFVGYKGAVWFIESKYGKDSKQMKEYMDGRKDDEVLEKFMLGCAHSLDSTYKKIPAGYDLKKKQEIKSNAFHSFVLNSKNLPIEMDTLFPSRFEKRIAMSGNAFFMKFVRYGSQQVDFENEYSHYRNIREYMLYLISKYGKE